LGACIVTFPLRIYFLGVEPGKVSCYLLDGGCFENGWIAYLTELMIWMILRWNNRTGGEVRDEIPRCYVLFSCHEISELETVLCLISSGLRSFFPTMYKFITYFSN
jgi:hypothetical protein